VLNPKAAQAKEAYTQLESVGKDLTCVNENLRTPSLAYEDFLFSSTIRNIQALDILLALQECRCYTLPRDPLFDNFVPDDIVKILAKRNTNFQEALLERKFRKDLGFYSFKIIKLCITSIRARHFR